MCRPSVQRDEDDLGRDVLDQRTRVVHDYCLKPGSRRSQRRTSAGHSYCPSGKWSYWRFEIPRSPSGPGRVRVPSRRRRQRSATADQIVHDHEGLAGGLADGEEPVVSHDECPLALHVLGETFTFFEREREAFPVVVADVAVEHRGVLHEVLEPVLERRDRAPRARGRGTRPSTGEVVVDRSVDHETGGVHVGRPFEHVARRRS